MLILPALPHFSEAMSNVSQPSEGAADAETSTEAECRGNLLQGTRQAAEQQRAAGLGRCMPRQVRMGPLLAWGGLRLGRGFSQYLNWADVKTVAKSVELEQGSPAVTTKLPGIKQSKVLFPPTRPTLAGEFMAKSSPLRQKLIGAGSGPGWLKLGTLLFDATRCLIHRPNIKGGGEAGGMRFGDRPKGDTFYINTIVILMGCGASSRGTGGGGGGEDREADRVKEEGGTLGVREPRWTEGAGRSLSRGWERALCREEAECPPWGEGSVTTVWSIARNVPSSALGFGRHLLCRSYRRALTLLEVVGVPAERDRIHGTPSSRGNNGLPASAFSSGAIIQACLGHKSTVLLERPAWPCLCCSMQRICRPHKPTCP
ncbi:hypothetical protein NQZ68_025218 [Dissostichus eleginoides]|nr:hypothetical protein NQZ68_025218 [Dissostichus eleginoides]